MNELFLLASVLAIMALVGHGIWVLMGAVFRGLTRLLGSADRSPIPAAMCPRCGGLWSRGAGIDQCVLCGWSRVDGMGPSRVHPERILRYLDERVERFHQLGLIPTDTRDRLVKAIRDEAMPAPRQAERNEPELRPVGTRPESVPITAEPMSKALEPVPALDRLEAVVEPEPIPPPSQAEPVTPSVDLRRRASAYRAFLDAMQEGEGKEARVSAASEPTVPSREPSRPLLSIFAAFLEEKNIRWGEFVGGLLIVGCSLALVISFWADIAARPFLKFGLFNGLTALLFAVGLHAERRWRLPTTAHGLLIIATLLTPLNFLAVASMVQGTTTQPAWVLGGEFAAIGLFAALTYRAGLSLVTQAPRALVLGVLVPSAVMLLLRRFAGPEASLPVWLLLAASPWIAHAIAVGDLMRHTRREPELSESQAHERLRLLGLSMFAAVLALGLLMAQSGPMPTALHRLALLLPLAGLPALAAGLELWRRTTAPALVTLRTTGAAIAAAGVLVMLAGIVLAWPDPSGMLPVALFNVVLLTVVAVAFTIPAAHVLAGACLVLAYLLVWLLATGTLGWNVATPVATATALLSSQSGAALVPIVLLFGGLTALGQRLGRRFDAQAHALVAGMAMVVSLGLVTWHGFGRAGDPAGATWVYGAYALLTVTASGWFGRHPLVSASRGPTEARALAWTGSALALAALVQGLGFGGGFPSLTWPLVVALLAHATLMVVLAELLTMVRSWGRSSLGATVSAILILSALATSIAAAVGLAGLVPVAASTTLAGRGLWLALVWLALIRWFPSPALFAAFQAALTGSVVFAVAGVLERQEWYSETPWPWLDPRTLQAQAIALGLLALVWIGIRIGVRRGIGVHAASANADATPSAPRLLDPPWPAFDRFLRFSALLVLVALAVYGVVPGAAQELTPRHLAAKLAGVPTAVVAGRVVPPVSAFELASVPHEPALGVGSWTLLVTVLAVLLAGQWERFRRVDLLAALLALAMAAPLAAGLWASDVAAASALRWSSAILLMVASVLIWNRERLADWAERLEWRLEPENVKGLDGLALGLILALGMLPVATMGAYVGSAALLDRALEPRQWELWISVGLLFIVLGATGLALRCVAIRQLAEPGVVLGGDTAWPAVLRPAGTLLMVLGTLPMVAVTVFVVGSALVGNPIVGPEPGSFFAKIGNAGSYVPPIVLIAATLVGYALRERSSGFAFAAGLILNLAATVGYLLAGVGSGLRFDAALWVRLAQLNAIVAAAYALAWIGVAVPERRRQGSEGPMPAHGLLASQVALGVVLNLLVLGLGSLALFVEPVPTPAHEAIASLGGWAALGLAVAAVVAWAWGTGRAIATDGIGLGVLTLAAFLALGLVFRDPGGWLTYHGLLVGQALAGWALVLVAWQRAGLRLAAVSGMARAAIARWSTVALGCVVLLALRAYGSDPQSPWWTVGGLAAMVPLAAALACWRAQPGFLTLAAVLWNLAVTLWWFETPWGRQSSGPESALIDLINLNVIALALPVPIWLALDCRVLRPARAERLGGWAGPEPLRIEPAPITRVAPWIAVAALVLVVVVGLLDNAAGGNVRPQVVLGWIALVAAAVAKASGLWDGRARGSLIGLYLLGLCASGWVIHQFHLPPRWLIWNGTMVLAAYSVATSYLWSRREGLRALADRLGIPRPKADDPNAHLSWLVPANLALAAFVLTLAFGVILTEPDALLRTSAAHAALAEVLTLGLLAWGERRTKLQLAALGVGVLGAVAWGWAWIAPEGPTAWGDRLVVILVASVAASALYGLGLAKLFRRTTEWTRAARRLVPGLLGLSAGVLAVVLGAEVLARAEGRAVVMSAPSAWAVVVALVGASAAALVAALVPGRDPLGLPERGRTAYVYGCEALLAVLVIHLRLTMPWLFAPFFAQYWPLILMGVAFLGLGLGELFRRQGRLVLAEPLERTGAFLPVLPLLSAFWTAPKPGEDVVFLVLVGSLYTTFSLLRSSVGFGALAALAFNGALWTVLGRWEGFGLGEHPQLWVLPPALCVLAGVSLTRDRLTETQAASIRYAAALAIYLSSTADMVLTGVAQAPWLPLVLAALAVVGIFAGILLRVRGFLFLGLGFLGLALFAMIWYAAVDLRQTWLWWACGIVTGILILALLALFEKRREEVLRAVDQLKGWEP